MTFQLSMDADDNDSIGRLESSWDAMDFRAVDALVDISGLMSVIIVYGLYYLLLLLLP